jgi:YD repeat-containing protein
MPLRRLIGEFISVVRIILGAALMCGMALVSAQAQSGSVTYTYDALGRVLTARYDTNVIVIYSYDANGNRTQQIINVNTGTLCWTATPCSGGTAPLTATWDAGLWH